MSAMLRGLIAVTCLLAIAFMGEHFWREGLEILALKRRHDAQVFLDREAQNRTCDSARRALAMIQRNDVGGIPLDQATKAVATECSEPP